MVKKIISILLLVLLVGCSTIYIPNYYYRKYKQIRTSSPKTMPIKMNGAYVTEFKSHHTNENEKDAVSYGFYYTNNLYCGIMIPFVEKGITKISNETELIDAIKNGTINKWLSWGYYKVEGNIIKEYGLTDNHQNPILFGYVLPVHLDRMHIINDTLIARTERGKDIINYMGLHWMQPDGTNEYIEIQCAFKPFLKPDSTDNDFIVQFNNLYSKRRNF
ncbi:MAG: hypothetical protein Q8908_05740 [Bacteroidota bacterium]|nr:hypothetical protein [Bacteroidota bacterium]